MPGTTDLATDLADRLRAAVEKFSLPGAAVAVLADGEVVSEGPTARVVAESPAFAPQVHKILGAGWLTVDQVVAAR